MQMMTDELSPEGSSDIVASGFFALRTPLLSSEIHSDWCATAQVPDADDAILETVVASDRVRLREGLAGAVAQPASREAVLVASPSLLADLERWERAPDSKHGRKVERALVRYFLRMTHRCTPFGLFAGVSVGTLGADTRLHLAPPTAYRRSARLDFGYGNDVVEHFAGDPERRARMHFVPSTGMYRLGDRLRYAEGRRVQGRQIYELSAVSADRVTQRVIALAAGGRTLSGLAEALVAEGWTTDPDEAAAFVDAMVVHRLLVAQALPSITGSDPFGALARELGSIGEPEAAASLEQVLESLERLELAELGHGLEHHHDIERALPALGVPSSAGRTIQIDLFKPVVEARLGERVSSALHRGVDVLRRIVTPVENEALTQFRSRFVDRWEDAEVPLVVALDDELGVWSDADSRPPVAAGLPLRNSTPAPAAWSDRHRVLLDGLLAARARGETTLWLDDSMIDAMSRGPAARLPDAFAVMAKVAARSGEDADDGRFEVLLRSINGPSGARMLGRFCHGDAELRRWVEQHLRDEEAARPQAIFAEVVHLPEGRLGNILVRPVLRRHEIAYLGQGSADADQVLSIEDLTLCVVGSRIVLRSRRLGVEIVPRLSSAHSFSRRSLGIYRFLCMLQNQDAPGIRFDWGPLRTADFLPRVQHGAVVFSLARWRLRSDELAPLVGATSDARRVRAARNLRAGRSLPRTVEVHDADNVLPIDFENVLTLETFAHLARSRPWIDVHEPFETPDTLLVTDTQAGRYTSEIIVPFVRRRRAVPTVPVPSRPRPSHREQRFAPGSRWLYAKLYTGTATADRVLREVVAPLTRDAIASGSARRWFFVRYGDPEWHVRLRIEGDPRVLWGEVLPALQDACAPWIADDRIHRLALDTYVRETARYGGLEGIELAEEIFFHDSREAVAALSGSGTRPDERWRLALAGVHEIFEGLGLHHDDRLGVLRTWTDLLVREHGHDSGLTVALGTKFRTHRKLVDAIVSGAGSEGTRHRFGADTRGALQALQTASAGGQLEGPLRGIAASLVHMHCNRLLRSNARLQELVVYDLLARGIRSDRARRAAVSATRLTEVA
jgi:lantibiotic biosynthesis protein